VQGVASTDRRFDYQHSGPGRWVRGDRSARGPVSSLDPRLPQEHNSFLLQRGTDVDNVGCAYGVGEAVCSADEELSVAVDSGCGADDV
jgi:hypothetical protein